MSTTAIEVGGPPADALRPNRPTFVCGDFPTWLPAVLVKELRQGLHTGGFVGMLLLFHAIMVVAMTTTVASLPGATPAARAAAAVTSNSFFWTLLAVMLLVVLPVRALFGLKAEVDSRTLDLLVLTHLTSWRIVVGKWASLVMQGFLLLVAMLPYGFVRYFAGSVNLADDGLRCLMLLSGCGLLTAAALLCSTLPVIAAIPVVLIVAYGGGITAFTSVATATAVQGPMAFASENPILPVFDGVLLLFFFLIMAVRRIAPPAENYAMLTRLLALPAFLPVPYLVGQGQVELARYQFMLAVCVTIIVCAIEIASLRLAMAVHLRGFVRRGPLGRLVYPLFMPGWPSALAFTVLAILLSLAFVWWGGLYAADERMHFARLAVLVAGGLTFPAVLRSTILKPGTNVPGFYGLVLVGLCLIALVTSVFSNAPLMPRWWLDVASVLPASSFWMEFTRGTPSATIQGVQWVISIAILVVAIVCMRGYWKEVGALSAKEQAG